MAQYPQVLFTGNGVNLAFGGKSWSGLLRNLSERTDLPDALDCPMPLQAIIYTENRLRDAMQGRKAELFGSVETAGQLRFLRKLLSLPFDEAITTNYSYELEATALSCQHNIPEATLRTMTQHSPAVSRAEPRCLLHTFNLVPLGGRDARVWHAHGEARKPDSMIIGHYYYARLLGKMIRYLDGRAKEHQRAAREGLPQKIDSWAEAFLFGDVYILGFGFDLSEFDLWWLLNRKKREKAPHGRTLFFEMKDPGFSERKDLLRLMGAEILDLGMEKPSKDDPDSCARYGAFYDKAAADIERMMLESRTGGA